MTKAKSHRGSGTSPSRVQTPAPVVSRLYRAVRPVLKNSRARGVLQLLLSVALLSWLVARVGLDQVVNTLSSVAWFWYLPAFLLFVLNVMIRAYRWYVLLRGLDTRVPYLRLVYLYFLGFFFNNFIPSGFGGDVVKVLSLPEREGQGAEALSSVVADRVTGLMGSSCIALVALGWNGIRARLGLSNSVSLPPSILVSAAAISLAVPVGFLILRQVDPLRFLSNHVPFGSRLTDLDGVKRLVQTFRCYPPSALGRALLVSLPFTLNLVVIQFSIARALSVEVPFRLFPLFVPLIAIINLLPLSFNGLGVREGAYQILFVPAGVSSAGAVAMSLAFYFLRVSVGLIGGLLYAVGSIRDMAKETGSEE